MKKSVLLYLLSILVFVVSCGTDDPVASEADDPAASETLSTKAGFYQSGNLMLEILESGNVDFSITGDFKDATEVITGKATDTAETFTFTHDDKEYELNVGNAKKPSSVKVDDTTLNRITKPLTLAQRAGFYEDDNFRLILDGSQNKAGFGQRVIDVVAGIPYEPTSTSTTLDGINGVDITFISATQATYEDTGGNDVTGTLTKIKK